jgi:hypothetical protein
MGCTVHDTAHLAHFCVESTRNGFEEKNKIFPIFRDKPDLSELMKMKSVRMTVVVASCFTLSQVEF